MQHLAPLPTFLDFNNCLIKIDLILKAFHYYHLTHPKNNPHVECYLEKFSLQNSICKNILHLFKNKPGNTLTEDMLIKNIIYAHSNKWKIYLEDYSSFQEKEENVSCVGESSDEYIDYIPY
ncbi:hypothetical protein NOVO_01835 [Rickettsiales bacterium Ac37b]|nr:hypothetical protein NOVO_01835 [Rickettsiales bacterium Ac37b]